MSASSPRSSPHNNNFENSERSSSNEISAQSSAQKRTRSKKTTLTNSRAASKEAKESSRYEDCAEIQMRDKRKAGREKTYAIDNKIDAEMDDLFERNEKMVEESAFHSRSFEESQIEDSMNLGESSVNAEERKIAERKGNGAFDSEDEFSSDCDYVSNDDFSDGEDGLQLRNNVDANYLRNGKKRLKRNNSFSSDDDDDVFQQDSFDFELNASSSKKPKNIGANRGRKATANKAKLYQYQNFSIRDCDDSPFIENSVQERMMGEYCGINL